AATSEKIEAAAIRHPIEPEHLRFGLVKRVSIPHQPHKHLLQGVLTGRIIAEDAPASPQHQRAVPTVGVRYLIVCHSPDSDASLTTRLDRGDRRKCKAHVYNFSLMGGLVSEITCHAPLECKWLEFLHGFLARLVLSHS